MNFRVLLSVVLIAAAAAAADQWVKYLVETRLALEEKFDVLPFLAFYRTYNTGIAFSLFASVADGVLIGLSMLVLAFVFYLATQTDSDRFLARAGFALIVGGAIGNLIDRIVHGHVIDYILFYTQSWSFAIFNLADAFITIGAALVLLGEFLAWRSQGSGLDPSRD